MLFCHVDTPHRLMHTELTFDEAVAPAVTTLETEPEVKTRHYLAPVAIGLFSLTSMFIVAAAKDLPIRDPDARLVGSPLALIALIVAVFVVLDVVPRAFRGVRAKQLTPREAIRKVFQERWWGRRGVIVVACILGFYATYLSYRNLKSFVPFVTPDLHDGALLDMDQWLFFGAQPANVLHDLLGTGISAHVLSAAYVAFLSFVPISLGVTLIWSSRVAAGVWYVTALTINWILGALSYYLVPSLGPIFVRPELFADLPPNDASKLGQTLLEHRAEVMANPNATDAVQSIAAFASLHMAVVFTAALIAQLLGVPRWMRIVLWIYLGLTALATIYFGWHYLIDDVAGIAIGLIAVYGAAVLTGFGRYPRALFARLLGRSAAAT